MEEKIIPLPPQTAFILLAVAKSLLGRTKYLDNKRKTKDYKESISKAQLIRDIISDEELKEIYYSLKKTRYKDRYEKPAVFRVYLNTKINEAASNGKEFIRCWGSTITLNYEAIMFFTKNIDSRLKKHTIFLYQEVLTNLIELLKKQLSKPSLYTKGERKFNEENKEAKLFNSRCERCRDRKYYIKQNQDAIAECDALLKKSKLWKQLIEAKKQDKVQYMLFVKNRDAIIEALTDVESGILTDPRKAKLSLKKCIDNIKLI
jgi:hypothetical protein